MDERIDELEGGPPLSKREFNDQVIRGMRKIHREADEARMHQAIHDRFKHAMQEKETSLKDGIITQDDINHAELRNIKERLAYLEFNWLFGGPETRPDVRKQEHEIAKLIHKRKFYN